jgi:tRNA 2-selenouridine synthase
MQYLCTMAEILNIGQFLEAKDGRLLLDVRSEGEYQRGHIPGAVNVPLLDNASRAVVGTVYKQEGREAAVLKGFELTGADFHTKIRQVMQLSAVKEVAVYCWRGGMRSNIFAWLLSLAGYRVSLLKGGYKSYRAWALDIMKQPRKVMVLGGYTGSGKTELLHAIAGQGEYTIDLEALASHKGSAFGALGQEPQPSTEQFENLLAQQWALHPDKRVWLENESRMIGVVKIPDTIYDMMREAPVIEILTTFEKRVDHILSGYGTFPPDQLRESTARLKKRLGDLRCRQALQMLEEGNMKEWAAMMLTYYDNFYEYGTSLRNPGSVHRVDLQDEPIGEQALRVIQAADTL